MKLFRRGTTVTSSSNIYPQISWKRSGVCGWGGGGGPQSTAYLTYVQQAYGHLFNDDITVYSPRIFPTKCRHLKKLTCE
jgi:hypothetical protein